MNQSVHLDAVVSADQAEPKEVRTHDPTRTMAEILEEAAHEFADKGLAGARIDAIAATVAELQAELAKLRK